MKDEQMAGDEWRRLCVAAGPASITLHAARTTSVTRLIRDAGLPVEDVALWHGHDPAVALRHYHRDEETRLAAAGAALAEAQRRAM